MFDIWSHIWSHCAPFELGIEIADVTRTSCNEMKEHHNKMVNKDMNAAPSTVPQQQWLTCNLLAKTSGTENADQPRLKKVFVENLIFWGDFFEHEIPFIVKKKAHSNVKQVWPRKVSVAQKKRVVYGFRSTFWAFVKQGRCDSAYIYLIISHT